MQAANFDVVVVGGGSAGIAAAISAAEEGAPTLLLEASGHVGGTLAWQLLEHSAGFHDRLGRQVTAGVGDRIIQRLRALGGTPGHVRDDVAYTATRTPVNHVELALTEAVMLEEAGATLWLHAPVVAVEREAAAIVALVVETPSGRRVVRPRLVVDASGDAVVARLAGAGLHDAGGNAPRQPTSLTFKLGGVDFSALLDYARNTPEDFRHDSHVGTAADEVVNLWGFGRLLARGAEDGLLSLLRTELHLAGWPRRGEAIINASRVPTGGAAEAWEGAATMALSRQVLEFANWFRRMVPGCAEAYVAAVADRLGVRESARVRGIATLTEADVMGGHVGEDAIALGAFPIDIHDASRPGLSHTAQIDDAYGIAYGCLVAEGLDNLLLAGRCVSSTHEANGSVRITATCFATGEAAGTAAAMLAQAPSRAAALDVARLRGRLLARGVLLAPV